MAERVIAVVGPTAAGKSELSLRLSLALGGEVVNADSMQLYAGMDIGTAKLSLAQRRGVPHHLLDIWDVRQAASVAEYQRLARAAITGIQGRGRVPVLAGGSGLYLRAALDNLEFPGTDPVVRDRLEAELAVTGPAVLHARLAALDPAAATAILPSNGRRIVRALKVIEVAGLPFAAVLPQYESRYPVVQIGLRVDRCELDRRIAERTARSGGRGWLTRWLPWSGRGCGRAGPPAGPSATTGAALSGRGMHPGRGPRADHPGDQAVRPAAGGMVPSRPPGHLAGRRPRGRRCPARQGARRLRAGGSAWSRSR